MPAPQRRVFVIGVGMTKFEKPGSKDWDYPDMAKIAVTRALQDACVDYKQVEQVCVGYCYGDSTCGQRAVYSVGMTGVPIYNVNNNCATGSTALYMARQFISGGVSDCCMALGFEKMERGSLGSKFQDRTNPMDKHMQTMMQMRDITAAPFAPQMFGNAGREHMEKYGTTKEHLAKIAYKNHKHSVNNPYSQFRDEYTLQDIVASPTVYEPLTKLQCCPTSDGSACAILASEDFVIRNGLEGQAVEIIGMAMATDLPTTFKESCIDIIGSDMTKKAARDALAQARVTPRQVQVVELHDCFSANELVTYEALGLCEQGRAGAAIDAGDFTYGGRTVVNPSGGLISKGHPLGATGLAQCAEICWQLRGEAGKRQVPNARVGMTHNLGLGGAVVVSVYKRPDEWLSKPMKRAVSGGMGFEDGPASGAAAGGAAAGAAAPAAGAPVTAAQIMSILADQIKAQPDVVKRVGGIYRFVIDGRTYTVNLKAGTPAAGTVAESAEGPADCILTVSDADFVALITGKANAQKLFMGGKLKMKGNMALAMKLQELQKLQSKL